MLFARHHFYQWSSDYRTNWVNRRRALTERTVRLRGQPSCHHFPRSCPLPRDPHYLNDRPLSHSFLLTFRFSTTLVAKTSGLQRTNERIETATTTAGGDVTENSSYRQLAKLTDRFSRIARWESVLFCSVFFLVGCDRWFSSMSVPGGWAKIYLTNTQIRNWPNDSIKILSQFKTSGFA